MGRHDEKAARGETGTVLRSPPPPPPAEERTESSTESLAWTHQTLRALVEGDDVRRAALVDEFREDVARLIANKRRGLAPADCDDLCAEVFLKVFEDLAELQRHHTDLLAAEIQKQLGRTPNAQAFVFARVNFVLARRPRKLDQVLRQHRAHARLSDDGASEDLLAAIPAPDIDDPADTMLRKQQGRDAMSELERFQDKSGEVITGVIVRGQRLDEFAAASTAHYRMKKGLEKLRKRLEKLWGSR